MDPDALASYEDIPQDFGLGLPWSMVAPLYLDQMGGVDASNVSESDAFNFWYNHHTPVAYTWDNEPTKFNESVRLEEVELIRYSKVPYMLSTVKMYRVNGEISPLDDTSGIILIAQQNLEYNYDAKKFIENYHYQHLADDLLGDSDTSCFIFADTLLHSSTYDQYVYTLNIVKSIPVGGWESDPSVADSYLDSSLLQTEFEYNWYGYNDGDKLVFDEDGHPGRRTRVMTKYTDQLGGITQIEYYPRNSKSTLKEGRYSGIQNVRQVVGLFLVKALLMMCIQPFITLPGWMKK